MKARCALVIAALVGVLPACANEQRTCQIDTSELVMWATVTDLNGVVEVEIELETFVADGQGSSLELCPNRDTLLVNGDRTEAVHTFGQYYYTATYEDELPDSYELVFERKDHDSVTVTVEMPPSFEVTTPEPDGQYARTADLPIAWSPTWADHEMQLSIVDGIGSSCIDGLGISEVVEDAGSWVVPANSLIGGGSGDDCEVSFSMARSLMAAYPAELHEGGEVVAFVRRGFSIVSTE